MRPFFFNEMFDVNTQLSVASAGVPGMQAVVIDGLFKRPDEIHHLLNKAPAANWKFAPDGRNFVDYQDCRQRYPIWYPNNLIGIAQQAIETVYGCVTRPQDQHVDVNWFRQLAPRRSDTAFPHHDIFVPAKRSFTCLTYVNTAAESSGGTAFYRFKPSGSPVLDDRFDQMVEQDAALVENGRDYWFENPERYWERIGVVDMVPNRFIIFPSEFYHAAYHPDDWFFDFPRMTLVFWMLLD